MSELYDLPNGWQWKKLDECTDKIIDGNYGESYPTKDEFIDSGIPFLTAAAIGVNGKIEYEKIKYISNEKHSILTKAQTTVGDVILVNRGVKNDFSNISSIIEDEYFKISNISPQLTKLKTNDLLKPKYLYYYFYSEPFLNQFVDLTMGSALRFISLTKTKKIEIPVPPLSEQQRIVSKLDLLFAKIDKSIELHQKNMDEADAFMGSVLNEVFGELEVEKSVSLKEITTKIGSGATPSGGEKSYKTEGISLIRSMNVHDDGFRFKNLAFIDESQAKKLNNVIVEANDVLLNITGASVARCCIVDQSILPARVNQHVSIIRLKSDMLPSFLHYYLVSPSVKSDLLFSSSGGATREAITKSMIEEFTVPLPLLLIQQKIVDYLDSVSEKMEKVKSIQKEKMESLKALKASILDKAFRGEL